MNPCPTCPFEWYDMKNKTSCRDECEAYRKWVEEKSTKE